MVKDGELTPKEKIAEVASALFSEKGYQKTTIAEIAAGAGMSPANIYRHYKDKSDILAAQAVDWFLSIRESIAPHFRDRNLTLEKRLYLILECHQVAIQDFFYESPLNSERTAEVVKNKPELVREHYSEVGSMVAEILAEGNSTGEFDVNVPEAAQAFMSATLGFTAPQFSVNLSQEGLDVAKGKAAKVVSLLVKGLKARP